MRGFTLLEVMVALAIMAGVILTVISAVNYHLSVAAADREETTAMLLARQKLGEMELAGKVEKEGTFAPERPEIRWETETTPTELPGVNRLTLTVKWGAGKKLSLVQYK
ncbi:MAG: type II secretion system minor pseudopilin GspI [Geobacter sp.]|nr:type II secretion system minor pseudopilin GspI [Geobacter sp.]